MRSLLINCILLSFAIIAWAKAPFNSTPSYFFGSSQLFYVKIVCSFFCAIMLWWDPCLESCFGFYPFEDLGDYFEAPSGESFFFRPGPWKFREFIDKRFGSKDASRPRCFDVATIVFLILLSIWLNDLRSLLWPLPPVLPFIENMSMVVSSLILWGMCI